MVEGWTVGLIANLIIFVTYGAVAILLAVNITRSRQWFANPLAAATAFIFATCAGGHAVHALQLADGSLGLGTAAGAASRALYSAPSEWHMWAWDLVTAGVGIWYWSLRSRFPGLVTGTAVFEDLRQRQKRALQINDNVVQGLVRAKLSYDLQRDAEGREALDETLVAGRRLVSGLESKPQEAT